MRERCPSPFERQSGRRDGRSTRAASTDDLSRTQSQLEGRRHLPTGDRAHRFAWTRRLRGSKIERHSQLGDHVRDRLAMGWSQSRLPADDGPKLYDNLYAQGARPAGLFAQTSMRIEKRFLAYSHDLDTDVTPLEAGVGFAVDWQKDFVGRDALLERREQSLANSLVTIVLKDREANPLGNEPVYHEGKIIGKITSAAFGYRIGRPLALACLDIGSALIADGMVVEIDIAGTRFEG